jgi:hypothetical protein
MAGDDDMAAIRKAIAESRQQLADDANRQRRAAAIEARQGQQLEHQQHFQEAMPAALEQQKKPVALAPKGIPMSLIVHSEIDVGELLHSARRERSPGGTPN